MYTGASPLSARRAPLPKKLDSHTVLLLTFLQAGPAVRPRGPSASADPIRFRLAAQARFSHGQPLAVPPAARAAAEEASGPNGAPGFAVSAKLAQLRPSPGNQRDVHLKEGRLDEHTSAQSLPSRAPLGVARCRGRCRESGGPICRDSAGGSCTCGLRSRQVQGFAEPCK